MEIDKLFEDFTFINSREGRAVRILSEFLETKNKLEKSDIQNTIVMFGSARVKEPLVAKTLLDQALKDGDPDMKKYENMAFISEYYERARILSNRLALWSQPLDSHKKFYICTGGGGGIMEACNKGAQEAGEKTVGFNIVLPFEQKANGYIEKELVFNFHYFFLRKFWFAYLAKAFIVFPGGFGTMDELFEILTLIQTHKMKKKMPIVLIGEEFFHSVFNIDTMVKYSLISEDDKKLFLITDDIEEAFNHITDGLKTYMD